MQSFTADAARALGGPDWLVDRRVAAAERAAALPLPSTDEEVWRYSRIAELDLDALTPATGAEPGAPGAPAGVQGVLDLVPDRSATVVLHDGRPVLVELDAGLADRGVVVAPASATSGAEDLVGAVTGEHEDLFGALNDAFCPDPVVVHVPRGVVLPGPVVVVEWLDRPDVATFTRLVVRLDEGAQADVVEWQGGGEVHSLAVPVLELDVDQGARLRHVQVQTRGRPTWQLARQVARVARDGSLHGVQAALGGDYARTRVDCHLVGRGAHGQLSAVYFGEDAQTLDFRTFQEHEAPDTTSDLLFKGAVGGTSRSVYTGTIRIDKGAPRSAAYQTNRNIKLSDGAWAESVPNLEIENNDVRCSHASTVSPVDEEQRYYLESRGVPTAVAERLIVAGFFEEVLARVPQPAVAGAVRTEIAHRLAVEAGDREERV